MPVPHKFRRFAVFLLAGMSAAALAEPSFVPVYRDNFPDPHVVLHGGEFIAYATNDGINLPMLVSRDRGRSKRLADAAELKAGQSNSPLARSLYKNIRVPQRGDKRRLARLGRGDGGRTRART